MSQETSSGTNTPQQKPGNERGFALIMTVLVVVIVGSLIAGATLIGTNHILVNNYYDRQSELEMVADAGLEMVRAQLNAVDSIYPDSGYVTLENGASMGSGMRRWLYVGPSGVTTGQYGVFGSIVSVVEDQGGGRVIRRSQIYQESFSKYAYFTDFEPSTIKFGNGDQIFGPVHSNSPIKIYAPSGGDTATFYGPVRTAQDVENPTYGSWRQGFQEYVSNIAMPATAELTKLQAQAAIGSTAFVGNSTGSTGQATTHVQFVAIDLNSDGDTTDDNEGFIRVYQALSNPTWVTGVETGTTSCSGSRRSRTCTTTGGVLASDLCGAWYGDTAWVSTNNHPYDGVSAEDALRSAGRRCYLGGHDSITAGVFLPTDLVHGGGYLMYPNTVHPLVLATGRTDAAYLFPISRALNPNFKGVIHVTGRVVVSGVIRGRVTIAATDDIIFGDDITYATDPGAGTCVDIAGYFAGDDVIVADNVTNAPQYVVDNHYTQDNTPNEFFHGTVLALDIFTVQNYNSGSSNDEPCDGNSSGRGCLFLTGGIIQDTRGAVGLTSGQGYTKRYAYDACGATQPPPYFPTTGIFAKGQYYQVDPAGFNIGNYFDLITP